MNQTEPPPTDEALLAAHQQGDAHALGTLWTRHGGALVGYATRMLQVREEAEDVAQEAFIQVLRGRWRAQGHLRAWLFTVVHRACVDRMRRRKRWQRVQRVLGWTPAPSTPPDLGLSHRQAHRALDQAIAQLPETHRAVMLLYYGQELSSQQVAQAVGCTDQQVRSQLSYARRKLRELMKEVP